MTAVKDILKDILAKLIRRRYDQSPPGKWPMEDSLAEFILESAAAAGLAVIQLPEPTDRAGYQEWWAHGWCVWLSKRDIQIRHEGHSSPAAVRNFAAALLAAAAAAERVTA